MALRVRRVDVTDEATPICGTPTAGSTRRGVLFRLIDEGTIEIIEADQEFGDGFPWSNTDGAYPITTTNAILAIADTGQTVEVAILEDDET